MTGLSDQEKKKKEEKSRGRDDREIGAALQSTVAKPIDSDARAEPRGSRGARVENKPNSGGSY